MIQPLLQVTAGFATGAVRDTLQVLSATTTEQVDNTDSASFRIALPTRVAISVRTPLRFLGTDGITREYRVSTLSGDPFGNWLDIECAPPHFDLATAGWVTQTVNGTTYTTIAATLSVAQWITSYVLTNLSADGLAWLDTVLGPIESAQLVTLSFAQWSRGQLLRALCDATGLELVLYQPSPGALYRIAMLAERGSDVNAIRVAQSGALLKLADKKTDEGLATVVIPTGAVPDGGTEPASIGNHVFTVGSIASGWVVLNDPTSTAQPIAFDDMANTWYLQFISGTTVIRRAISDSRASDGAVLLSDTSSLVVGANVTLVADSAGSPVTSLSKPDAVTQFGRVVAPLSVSSMRGEANRVANANFAMGAARWSAPGIGWLEPYPTDEVTDLVAAANGATSGGSTTLPIDGLASGKAIRKGERLEVGEVVLATTNGTKTIPSSLNVTASLSGTLAQNVANGAQLTEYVAGVATGRVFAANGAQSAGASTLALTAPNGTRKLLNGDQLRFITGGAYAGVSDSYTYAHVFVGDETWSFTMNLAQPLYATTANEQLPQSPAIAAGQTVTLQYYYGPSGTTGLGVFTLTADYHANDTSIALSFAGWDALWMYFGPASLVFATVSATVTKSVTNSDTEWPDNKQIAVTWSGSLAISNIWRTEWLDASGNLLGTLSATGTVSGTGHTYQNDTAYQLLSGAVFKSQPQTLYAQATVNANTAGQATVNVGSVATSILDNAVVRIVRNVYGWPDQGSGSTTLLRSSVGGWISDDAVVIVPAGSSRTVWAHFAGVLWSSQAPSGAYSATITLSVKNAATNATLGTVTSDTLTLSVPAGQTRPTPIAFVVKVQIELTATTRLRLDVSSTANFSLNAYGYAMASYAMITEGTDPNVPFTASSHANVGWQAGVRYLNVYAREVRSVSCTMAQLADIVGAQIAARRVACGVRLTLADIGEALRVMAYTRVHLNPHQSSMLLETLRRTAAKLLGTGSASVSGGSGSTSSVTGGSGSGGGTTTPTSLTVVDDSGNEIPGVSRLLISGLGVALSANGNGGARVLIPTTVDPTGVDAVITGGNWVTRDLVTAPSFDITVAAGTGVIGGKLVSWAQTTVTTAAVNSFVYVDAAGIVRQRAAGSPETLPTAAELLLFRTYVDVATYGNRIYAVAESRTFYRVVPRAPLYLKQRVSDAVVASGTWANAVAQNATGDINWYFANLGLYPFVEELPSIVQAHLDLQITKFYGSGGTANSAPTWNSVHGTTYGGSPNYLRWPYDVGTPRGTPTVKRADSHDAYAGSFLRLAVRYATVASGGLTWWDTNIAAIQDALYYNILTRLRLVNGGAGYMVDTFQDNAVYPFNQTLDNIEAYRGCKDALDLMTARGGAQATWAGTYSTTPGNLLSGIYSQWSTGANAAGESGWMSVAYDNGGAAKLTNELTRFYPDLTICVPAFVYDVPINGTDSISRDRLDQSFRWLNAKASTWFMSRKYDLYPWGIIAASAAKAGFRDLADRWLAFVQSHHAYDSTGYFLIHDIGWARYVERVLQGDTLT